jgi:uncharacterized protein YfiM (DUF2279 family)
VRALSPRERFLAGCNAFIRPTWRQYLVLQASCFASLAVGAAAGYLVAPGRSVDDSKGAGIGLLVGLFIWTIGVGRLIWVGGPTQWRDIAWRRR